MRRCDVNCESGVTIFTPSPGGDIWLHFDRDQGDGKEILELASKVDPPRVVFDLERTEWINGSFLGLLGRLWTMLRERSDWKLGVCNASSQCRETMDITKFSVIVKIFDSRDAAISAWGDQDLT